METICPKCQKKYKVPDDSTGKQVRCKNEACRQVFPIAARAASAAAPAPPATPKITPAGVDGHAMSSLLDDLPPLPLDGLPQAEAPAVVLTNYKPSRPKGAKKWPNSLALKVGGGIVAVLIVAGLIWAVVAMLSGGGIPAWAVYYIPENTQWIAYVNLDKLRGSDLYAQIRKGADKRAMQIEGDVDADDVSEAFVAGAGFGPADEPLVVLRTTKDRPLKEFLPKERRDQPTQSFKSIEYAGFGKSADGKERVCAKTGERTYCFAASEDALKQAIQRLDRKERAKLDKNLQAGLDAVAGGNLYAAGINLRNAQMPFAIEMFNTRAWVTSAVQIEATVVFADANDAEKCKKMIDGFLANLTKLSTMMPGDQKKELESLLSGVNFSQDGKELRCEAKWNNADVMALVKKAQERSQLPGQSPPNQPGPVPPSQVPGRFGAPPPPVPIPGMPGM
jgi:hypothetical protein